MPWTAQVFETEVYTSQEPPSPLVYALDGEQVFALDGSLVLLFVMPWVEQTDESEAWT